MSAVTDRRKVASCIENVLIIIFGFGIFELDVYHNINFNGNVFKKCINLNCLLLMPSIIIMINNNYYNTQV